MGFRDGPTPSLRAQRSNPESFRGGILDCFATLAMTCREGTFQWTDDSRRLPLTRNSNCV
ncbi:hypothetical protein E4K65_16465 [Bradyrhizobium niftali]|uniref:Uncharacterized protein n=1 Tax=Bradyrhizobium niftali TaxID=2560055 RepID=A0A4Y9LWR8_9BRAD|nr:hypothetical protein E4K65_16465 [Bradyrhizobium niftali]